MVACGSESPTVQGASGLSSLPLPGSASSRIIYTVLLDLPTAREQSPGGVVTDDSVVLEQRCHEKNERCWGTLGTCSHPGAS